MNNKIKIAIPVLAVAGLITWKILSHGNFRYNGTVEATEVNLSPRISSTISTVTVQEGDIVAPGQELVALGCEDLKLGADIAAHDFERSERLYKVGSTPFETFDRDRNRRDMTALNVAWCRISAPIHGVVLARLHEPGEWASPGVSLLTLADLDQLYVYAYVPQTVLYKVHPGDAVTVYLPEDADKPRKGRVAFVRPEAEFTPKNVQTREERARLVYGVKVMLDNADQRLKPGMPIEIALPQS